METIRGNSVISSRATGASKMLLEVCAGSTVTTISRQDSTVSSIITVPSKIK